MFAGFIVLYQRRMSKNAMVEQIAVKNNKIYQVDLVKEVVLSCSTKGKMTGSFVEHPVHFLLSENSQQNWTFLSNDVTTNKIYH